MKTIATVLFDWDGTLLRLRRSSVPGFYKGTGGIWADLLMRGLPGRIYAGLANPDRVGCEFERLGLSFPAIVCHEDVVDRKPYPEGIERALALLQASAESCCFVGGAPEDIEMAKREGVFTVGVVSDYVTRGRMELAAPGCSA